jgi:cobalt-zinc-cadmium efflux system outer membrane protein
VEGTLLPPVPPAPLESQLAALTARPDLRGLEQRVAAAELEQKAAIRWWFPEIALGAGIKQIAQGPFDDLVPLVSTAIALPVLDRQQPERSRADAQAQLARSQRNLLLARAAGDVRGLWQQANRLSNAARRFREKTVQLSPELIRIAEAAYRGGETGILELLDAHRSRLEADLQTLDLELSARQAGIELDRLTGRSVVRSLADRNDQGSMRKARTATP